MFSEEVGNRSIVSIDTVHATPSQMRTVDRQSLRYQELKSAIRDHGILMNIVVKPCTDGFEVIDGMHRYTAAQELGVRQIPIVVRNVTHGELMSMQLMANATQLETSPIEYADQLQRIIQHYEEGGVKLKINELAKMVCKSQGWVSKHLSLANLHPDARTLLEKGEIKMGHAVELAKIAFDTQEHWIPMSRTLTVREFQLQLGRWRAENKAEKISTDDLLLYGSYKPRVRPLKYIVQELETMEETTKLITKHGITDPIVLARHLLEWVLHLDEESRKQLLKNHLDSLTLERLNGIISNSRYVELQRTFPRPRSLTRSSSYSIPGLMFL